MYQKYYLSITYRTGSVLILLYVIYQPGLSLGFGDQGFPLTRSAISMTPGFYFHSRKL